MINPSAPTEFVVPMPLGIVDKTVAEIWHEEPVPPFPADPGEWTAIVPCVGNGCELLASQTGETTRLFSHPIPAGASTAARDKIRVMIECDTKLVDGALTRWKWLNAAVRDVRYSRRILEQSLKVSPCHLAPDPSPLCRMSLRCSISMRRRNMPGAQSCSRTDDTIFRGKRVTDIPSWRCGSSPKTRERFRLNVRIARFCRRPPPVDL